MHAEQRVAQVPWLHAHVQQALDRLGRRAPRHRRQHQPARHRRFGGQPRGGGVADRVDQDDVGVRGHHRPQRLLVRVAVARVDLDLAHTGQAHLDALLDGDDLAVRLVHQRQLGEQGRGAPGAGRTDREQHPRRTLEHGADALLVLRRETQAIELQGLQPRRQPEHHVLETAMRRQRRHAQLDLVRLHQPRERQPALLRVARVVDVQLGQRLDARNQAVAVAAGQLAVRLHAAVAAQAHPELVLAGMVFEVDAAGAAAHGVGHQRDQQLHDRAAGPLGLVGLRGLARAPAGGRVGGVARLGDRTGRRGSALQIRHRQALVAALDRRLQIARARQRGCDRAVGQRLQLLQHGLAGHVLHRHHQPAGAVHQRQHLQRARQIGRQPGQRLDLRLEGAQVDDRIAQLARQRHAQLLLRDPFTAQQHLAQRLHALGDLLAEHFAELLVGDIAQRHQRLAQPHHRHARLLVQRREQLFGRDDLARDQQLAELLATVLLLDLHRLLDLLRRDRRLFHQQLAQPLADQHAVIGRARHEGGLDRAAVVQRREQEQADLVLDMADRDAAHRTTAVEVDGVGLGGVVFEHLGVFFGGGLGRRHGGRRLGGSGSRSRRLAGQWHGGRAQRDAPDLVEAHRQRDPLRRHLHPRDARRHLHRQQLAGHQVASAPLDLAGQRLALRLGQRVGGERRRRPGERRVTALARTRRQRQRRLGRCGGLQMRLGQIGHGRFLEAGRQAVVSARRAHRDGWMLGKQPLGGRRE